MNYLDTPVTALDGIGKVRGGKLIKLGISTVKDLIYFFPRAYENRGNIKLLSEADEYEPSAFILTVGTVVKTAKIRSGLTISKFRAFDASGSIEIVFFNSPFVKNVFTIGSEFRFYGKISFSKKHLQLQNPKYEPYVSTMPLADLVPIYHQTDGISSKYIAKLVEGVLDAATTSLIDFLPEDIRLNNSLPTIGFAIKNIHFPGNEKNLSKALKRLSFDEMFVFGVGISLNSHYKIQSQGFKFSPCNLSPVLSKLPYELTSSQKNAVNDIYRDTVIGKNGIVTPMARIIVGDVGSGKTIVSALAMYIAVNSGYQTALMVPTEILARQHFAEMKGLFSDLGIKCELLVGQTSQKEKNRIYSLLEAGDIDILIGTHALISDRVNFKKLGLVITDEQHRFGVAQRAILKEKSTLSHLLVMSATPIPRTLALSLYGDLDISKITELPKGRKRVDTFVVNENYRLRLNDFIYKQVSLGGQCYIVCPSIEKSEDGGEYITPSSIKEPLKNTLNLKNAVEYTENLKRVFPDLTIECLHGKMKAKEKDAIMTKFAQGEIKILVSTTVIEVGINVPGATLMVVENAERFGLSQLHQLRGRVGRGTRQSYCVLVSDTKSGISESRLEIMRTTYDGYEIAEQDLALRGPGDFFSKNSDNNFRQSGGFDFQFASICDDEALMKSAFLSAKALVDKDPQLTNPDNIFLRNKLEESFSINSSSLS